MKISYLLYSYYYIHICESQDLYVFLLESFQKLGLNIGLVINSAVAYGQCPTETGYYGPDIEVKIIDLLDDPKHGEPHEKASDALPFFPESNAAIAGALASGKGALVHCYGSISRSAVLIIAFLMVHQNVSAEQATDILKSKWDAVLEIYRTQ